MYRHDGKVAEKRVRLGAQLRPLVIRNCTASVFVALGVHHCEVREEKTFKVLRPLSSAYDNATGTIHSPRRDMNSAPALKPRTRCHITVSQAEPQYCVLLCHRLPKPRRVVTRVLSSEMSHGWYCGRHAPSSQSEYVYSEAASAQSQTRSWYLGNLRAWLSQYEAAESSSTGLSATGKV